MYKHITRGDEELMEARLQKWGNSLGIRIPSNILKSLKLNVNDRVDLTIENDKVIITKSLNDQFDLEEKFREYKGDNLAKEFVWDESVGQ